jgi:hypothetical protein
MDCGITNFGSCIPQIFFNFIINLLNAPLQPLLTLVKNLLTNPINLNLFSSIWAIIVYVLSMFYGLLMLYSGFNFMISGYDAVKRAKAKEWFRNIFIMIVLVQASFFIYQLIVDLGSLLTSGVLSLVDNSFFLLTGDNITNIGLQFIFVLVYVFVLLCTVIILTLRYLIIALGVVFVPIGIFCYFIPSLNSYGRLILNFLGICIFLAFIDALIFLVCSQLLTIPLFQNFKILVMISAFLFADLLMLYLMFFSAIKSSLDFVGRTSVIVASVGKYFT